MSITPLFRSRTTSVLLATGVLVGAANLGAYAATGQPLLQGRVNVAARPTVLRNSAAGPALQLRSKPTSASLTVSSTLKVPRLNADRVDGLEGASLQTRSVHFLVPTSAVHAEIQSIDFRLPPGTYQASYSLVLVGDDPAGCAFGSDGAVPHRGLGYVVPSPSGGYHSVTGSSLVTVPSSGRTAMFCFGTGAGTGLGVFSSTSDSVSSADFVRVDQATIGAAPVTTARAGHGREAPTTRRTASPPRPGRTRSW